MVEQGTRGRICHAIHRYFEVNNKCMKNYDKNEESLFPEYLEASNLYGWAMSQPLLVYGFDLLKNLSKINEDFIKNYDKNSDKEHIFGVDIEYPRNYMIYKVIYHFY